MGPSGFVVRHREHRAGVELNLFHHLTGELPDVREFWAILWVHDNPVMTAVIAPPIDLHTLALDRSSCGTKNAALAPSTPVPSLLSEVSRTGGAEPAQTAIRCGCRRPGCGSPRRRHRHWIRTDSPHPLRNRVAVLHVTPPRPCEAAASWPR